MTSGTLVAGWAESNWAEFGVGEYVERCYANRILDVDRELILGVIDAMTALDLRPSSWLRAADVGAGPNLFPGLLLAPFLGDGGRLELIEPSEANLRYLRDVVTGTHDSGVPVDIWDKFERLMAGRSEIWHGALTKLKSSARVVAGSIYRLESRGYDAVSAYFSTESITASRQEFEAAVAGLVDAARPGGFVMAGHMLGSSGWHAGPQRYPAVPVTTRELRDIYRGLLDDVRIVEPPLTPEVRDDYNGAVVVTGVRKPG